MKQKGFVVSDHVGDRFIDRKELRTLVPFTPQYILKLEKKGMFPKRHKIGQRRVAWLYSEVQEWIREKSNIGFG